MKNTIRTVLFAVTFIMVTQVSVSAIPVLNGGQTEQSQLEEVEINEKNLN